MSRISRQRARELTARDTPRDRHASMADASVSQRLAEARPDGAPLESTHRAVLESRLGHQFSHVRIHADTAADGLAKDLDARAFAVGNDVFFRSGEFEPETPSGLRLLAHESAHTTQQSRADDTMASRPAVEGDQDSFEQEASRMGDAAIDPSIAPPSALSPAVSTQAQLWPWSDDEKPAGGGGSLWDTVAAGASTAADYAGSGAKAAYDGYQKSTDFTSLQKGNADAADAAKGQWGEGFIRGGINGEIDNAEKLAAAGNQKMVDDSKGTWYEGLAKGAAWMNNTSTQVTGGVLKGVGDLGFGMANMVAHPLDAVVGKEGNGGLLSIAEHNLPFGVGSLLKAGHGLVDLGLGAAGVNYKGQGQYGNSLGDLGNHVFNPLQSHDDDKNFNNQLVQGIVDPDKKGWEGFKDKPAESIARAVTNIAPIALGIGEAAGAGEAGLAKPGPAGVIEPAPPTLRSPALPEGVPAPGPAPSPFVEPTPGAPVPEPTPIPAGPKTLRSPGTPAVELPPDTIPNPPIGPKPPRVPGEPFSEPPQPAPPVQKPGTPIPREEVPSGPIDTAREIPPDFFDPPEPLPSTQPRPASAPGSGPITQDAPSQGSAVPTERGLGGPLPAIPRGMDPGGFIELLLGSPGGGSVVELLREYGMPISYRP